MLITTHELARKCVVELHSLDYSSVAKGAEATPARAQQEQKATEACRNQWAGSTIPNVTMLAMKQKNSQQIEFVLLARRQSLNQKNNTTVWRHLPLRQHAAEQT